MTTPAKLEPALFFPRLNQVGVVQLDMRERERLIVSHLKSVAPILTFQSQCNCVNRVGTASCGGQAVIEASLRLGNICSIHLELHQC